MGRRVKQSGIYRITNRVNGKFYIGSTVNLPTRFAEHRHGLRHGLHRNPKLLAAWNKYGETAFCFELIESVQPTELLIREQHYLDALHPPYNIAPIAGSQLGMKHSKKTRAKLSAFWRGRIFSAEHRNKLAQAHKGKPRPPHIQQMLRTARLGTKSSAESIARQSAAQTGVKFTEGRKARISEGLKRYYRRKNGTNEIP